MDGKVIGVTHSMEELHQEATRKLGIPAEQFYTSQGGLIDDIKLVRDDDVLYVSSGEPFKAITAAVPVSLNVPDERANIQPVSHEEWVTLNVGGTNFTTTRSTLTRNEPDSMLARMFARDEAHTWCSRMDSNGAFLIDRSPKYFEPILNYLRHSEVVIDKDLDPRGVLEEAKFFGIESMIEMLEAKIRAAEPASDQTPVTRREFMLKLMTTPSNCELRCQGLNFADANLSRMDLRYVNFKYANLRRANLGGANLSYCNFERADMSYGKLDGANLLGAKMLCVNLERASLQGCNFEDPAGSRANMEGANMKHVNLQDSHMASVNLRVATLKNANLQNCDLRGAVLAGADLENCDLSGCDLHEANLRGANLKGAAFELMLNPLHMSQTVP